MQTIIYRLPDWLDTGEDKIPKQHVKDRKFIELIIRYLTRQQQRGGRKKRTDNPHDGQFSWPHVDRGSLLVVAAVLNSPSLSRVLPSFEWKFIALEYAKWEINKF